MPTWLVDPDNPRPSLDDVIAARERLRGIAVRTPLLPLNGSETIWLKPEVLQPTGSFKLRGIYNAVAAIGDEARAGGVSIASSGNAAQALAWSARRFDVPARALVPANAPRMKIDSFLALGGSVELRDPTTIWDIFLDQAFMAEPDAFIHPTADRNVVAGYGAIALEILEDMPDVEAIYVPVGGGGLVAGIANVVAALAPNVRVVGVQPATCTPIIQGVAAGEPVVTTCATFCDGVAGTFMDADTWPLLRDLPLEWATAEEHEIEDALRHLALRNKLIAEGSGALPVAAALRRSQGAKCVALVSGGSIDAKKLARIVSE
ncbi:MAG: threonine/serine dehydratase [Chloroflexota bacterium]|nr:threonine/serine dehydratase [Chloroflexota bacterium]